VVTLLVSGVLLGLIGFSEWRKHRALTSDTQAALSQTHDQLVRAITSRRGTLTFIRDTLNRRADLTLPQLQALGASATQHTRHLLGTGLTRASGPAIWWSVPTGVPRRDLAELGRAIAQRAQMRGVWRVPSTFVATTTGHRLFLVMFEPLKTPAYRHSAIVGIFDLRPLLEDFFASGLVSRHPAQLLDGATMLYRSAHWPSAGDDAKPPIIVERPLVMDAARWTIQMQPGATGVVQTLSWLGVLLVVLSIVAGLSVTVVVWILAARTWILQRAVQRRTAALRRTSQRLRQLAITDELTGLYNRRFFLDRWTWECGRAKRYRRPLACLMVDVNGFKQVNDRLGHLAGDLILQHVAKELQAALRHADILARFGGDEFIIALPETSPAQAELVAEKLRQVRIEVPGIEGRHLPPIQLSVGLSRVEGNEMTPHEAIQAADASLYSFKRRSTSASHRVGV
jgi:diguanylate cyclase (GGDEF)-like protein